MRNRTEGNYADELKEALEARKNGTADSRTDSRIGEMLYSIARWAINDEILQGKLYKEASRDHDFVFLVLTAICSCMDKADLDKRPKQLVMYFKRVGSRAIMHHVRDSNRLKRRHEDVDILDSDLVTDFYGHVAAN